jgi:hypothetical protein
VGRRESIDFIHLAAAAFERRYRQEFHLTIEILVIKKLFHIPQATNLRDLRTTLGYCGGGSAQIIRVDQRGNSPVKMNSLIDANRFDQLGISARRQGRRAPS